MMLHRYFIWLSYKGTAYCGWQIQPGSPSVQQTLNNALAILLGEDVVTTGAGRTDTGVHASSFVAHFDTIRSAEEMNLPQMIYKLNRILPDDMGIQRIKEVKPDAHARFDALHRTYTYIICTRKDPFYAGRSWIMERPLEFDALQKAAVLLTEYRDFSAFARSNTQTKTNLCDILYAKWEEQDHLLFFEIRANRFLRNMVRAIVGTLVEAGLRKLDEEGLRTIIESKDRSRAGYSAPGCGLYLSDIHYPPDIFV
jgi:tRNA pseudouridine38-40 synthase